MAVTATPYMRTYISEFRKQDIRADKFFYTDYLEDSETRQFHMTDNMAKDFTMFLSRFVKVRILTNEEYRKWRFNPWRMSEDLYKTTELWFMLLHVNEMFSAREFNKMRLKVYTEDITRYLQEIRSVNEYFLGLNEASTFATKKMLKEAEDGATEV